MHWTRDLLIESPIEHRERRFTAIRTERYLYVEYALGDRELYDLARDPNQLTSLHADPSSAALRAELAAKLAKLRACQGQSCR